MISVMLTDKSGNTYQLQLSSIAWEKEELLNNFFVESHLHKKKHFNNN